MNSLSFGLLYVIFLVICACRPSSCCKENGFNMCKNNRDCCSSHCDKPKGRDLGICTRATTIKRSNADSKCKGDSSYGCSYNNECCCGHCHKPSTWRFGICEPKCGTVSSSSHRPGRLQTRQASYGEFPWHANIYQYNATNFSYHLICGGTLISHRVVITVAHCVTIYEPNFGNIATKHTSTLKVALGKLHKTLGSQKDDLAQIFDVAKIEVSPQYRGRTSFFSNDIALITLNNEVEYSKAVRPVCLDTGRYDNFNLDPSKKGTMAVWGTDMQHSINDTLNVIEMSLLPRSECMQKINRKLVEFVTGDKICGGDKPNIPVCNTGSGGGLVFEDPKSKSYFLRGIFSIGYKQCKVGDYLLFTNVSSHKQLVTKYLENTNKGRCEPLISKKLSIRCDMSSGKNFLENVKCDKPVPSSTKAHFSCNKSNYMEVREPEYQVIYCKNGRWDLPLVDDFCGDTCGKSVLNLPQPNLSTAWQTTYGEIPWHAGIYQYNERLRSYDQICGGSLISQKVVITAVECVAMYNLQIEKFVVKNLGNLRVALGKYFRTFNALKDTSAQVVGIRSVEIAPENKKDFTGKYYARSHYDNIAILTLSTEVKFTGTVRPICLDIGDDDFEKDQLRKGVIGKAAGWGIKTLQGAKEALKIIEMPLVPKRECEEPTLRMFKQNESRKKANKNLNIDLYLDQMDNMERVLANKNTICAGDESSNMTICEYEGNIGGGLVVEQIETKSHYLRGVFLFAGYKCKGYAYFARLSLYKETLKKYIPDCKGVCKRTCGRKFPSPPSNPLLEGSAPTISPAIQFDYGPFPWHAGIYQYSGKRSKYNQICGGTLISRKTIITAAQCFSSELGFFGSAEIDPSTLKVALGKLYRSLYAPEDDSAQIQEVERVEVPEELIYTQRNNYQPNDIAFVVLTREVELTRAVRPVCVDVGEESIEHIQLVKGAIGKIMTWGRRSLQAGNDTLKLIELPYVPHEECKNVIDIGKSDKICAKDLATNYSLCDTDRGGGLVIKDMETSTYYLRGVFTSRENQCKWRGSLSEDKAVGFETFTKVSAHKKLVLKYLQDCTGVCKRTCGRCVSNLPKRILMKARQAAYGEFPWHAGIFHYNTKRMNYDQICGGSLISHKIVITAAQCVAKWEQEGLIITELSTLKVALGKYYSKNFNDPKDQSAQFIDVKNIEISQLYRGSSGFHANDIGFLTLKTEVVYNDVIRPICLDIGEDTFEDGQLKKQAIGKIIGWGIRTQGGSMDPLKVVEMPLVPRDECIRKISSNLLLSVSEDKICAGNKFSKLTLCNEDIGGGLIFEDPVAKRYFLRGIFSLGTEKCEGKDYVLITRLSAHKELVRKYLEYCEGFCKPTTCEPLISKTSFFKKLQIICYTPNGLKTRCDQPLPSNSRASFFCNPNSYESIKEPEYNIIKCKNGKWDRPLIDDFCDAACGRSVAKLEHQPVVSYGRSIEYGEFPWHAGLFQFNRSRGSFELICGGTLISRNVVITAAHCVSTENRDNRRVDVKEFSTLKIGVGKNYRSINDPRDRFGQIIDVENIDLPPQYLGYLAMFDYDIAFITLKKKVEYNVAVGPVCLDIGEGDFESNQLKRGAIGKVVGWGFTNKKKVSEKLIMAEMPFVPRDECISKITNTLVLHANRDKVICAGNKSSIMSVCQGDSGGGLVFEDPGTKVYYLRGIVSLGPRGCKGDDYALFTKLSSYKALVERHLQLP